MAMMVGRRDVLRALPCLAVGLLAKPWKWFRPRQKQQHIWFPPKWWRIRPENIGTFVHISWVPLQPKPSRPNVYHQAKIVAINKAEGYLVLEY